MTLLWGPGGPHEVPVRAHEVPVRAPGGHKGLPRGLRKTQRGETRRESVNGIGFPMSHLSRRGDKRVEMGHRPPKGAKPSHLITYGCSFRPSVGQNLGGRTDG
jgi:hypothetical protein